MKKTKPFQICTCCKHEWATLDEFINDDDVSIVGYQVNFDTLEAGFFLFNHSCMSTFGVTVQEFSSLYDGPVYKEKLTGSEECPGYCLHKKTLEPCPCKCECAFVREIIQKLK